MKFSKGVFVVVLVIFTATNALAIQHGSIGIENDSGISNVHKLNATLIGEQSGCSGKVLRFSNGDGWGNVSNNDLYVYSDDFILRQIIAVTHGSFESEALFAISSYDSGAAYVCVNNALRFTVAAKMANTTLSNSIKPLYTSGGVLKNIFDTTKYGMYALRGNAIAAGGVAAVLTGFTTVLIGHEAIGAMLPTADEFIKNNLYLWYGDSSKRTFGNVSARDICSASGSNWLQKIFIEYRLGWLDSFCQNYDNEANLTLNTSSDTATLTSNVPLHSNGAKTLTVSFSQAGVTSAQVRSGIGQGYGGNANGGPEGTGSGYDPDPNGDTWAGYDHHVGLKYMKIGKKSSGNWDGSKVWSIDDIPNRRDFRVKLKKKGGVWPDVCAEVWFTHNKYFTDDDWHLNTECKNLSDSQYDDYDYKSVYVKDVYIPNEMEAGKNYYFFTRVTYPGGVNPSSRSTSDEYIKVEIIDFSSEFEVDTVIGEVPLGVFFTNKSKLIKNDSVNESITYHWDFGDGTTSSEENPAHLYETTGTYTARLTTAASWGEVKTSQTKVVTVIEPEKQGLSTAQKMEILW